jgi:zinc protease
MEDQMAKATISLPRLDIHTLPGPENIHRHLLPNGIVILVRENFASPSVVFSGYIPGGSFGETEENAGLADLTISALMRGTLQRDFQEIYESIESVGASLALGTGKHTLSMYGKSLAEDLELLLELLSEVLRNPAFPETQVSRLRAEKLTSLALREQSTGARAQLAFNELAYPDHPYRVPTDGYVKSLQGFKLPNLREYHHRHVGPRGMVITFVGAVHARRVIQAVEQEFGDWENPDQESFPEIPSIGRPSSLLRKDIHLDGKVQSDLIIGSPGPNRYEPDYLAASLGNSILGRFGLYGRIGDRVREAAGLAYYAYSSLSGGPGPGAWQVIAGVNPINVNKAVDLIRDEIRKFVTKQVSQEELTDNQANFIGRLPLQLESNEGVAKALVHLERYNLGLDYYQRYPEKIASIKRNQILAISQKFLHPDHLVVGSAGPKLDEA